jgi:hypothetical protein
LCPFGSQVHLSLDFPQVGFARALILSQVIIPPLADQVKTRRFLAPLWLFVFFVSAASSQELKHRPAIEPSTGEPVDQPVDVISSSRLNPPLRADSRVRFSPDGSYLLVQDQAGIFVLLHRPLQILLYADIGRSYPAAFSADSQEVSILGRNLVLTTWKISEPRKPRRRELSAAHGCLDAQLSPDAAWIFCFTPEFVLELYRTSDLQRVFSQRITPTFSSGALAANARERESAFSSPFGFMVADFAALADRGAFRSAISFGPSSKFLLVNEETSSFRLELPSLQKAKVPGPVHKAGRGILCFPSDDRVLISETSKDSAYLVLSLLSGDTLASPTFTADRAVVASNPRLVLLMSFDAPGVTLFDLQKNSSVSTPGNIGADVFGEEVAVLNSQGELGMYPLGDEHPVVAGRLPLGPFPSFRSVSVDSSLSTAAISLVGGAARFDLATGKRLSELKSFHSAASFTSAFAFLATSPRGKAFPAVSRWTWTQLPPESPAWTADNTTDLISSRDTFIAYSFYHEMGMYFPLGFQGQMPFELRGMDPATGRERWHHSYRTTPPVPFSDPQGGRMVLGWDATSAAAQSAAKRFPPVRETFRRRKIKGQDSFFEVLDASSGASLGGVLVPFGSGPISFGSAFSAGDFLFLTKDEYRLTIFRLSDGTVLGRFRGRYPAVSEAAKIFAVDDGAGKLTLYSLETAAKLAERRFSDYINYLRFSETGDRLLVLTAHQMVHVLDVKKTIEAFPAAGGEPPVSEPEPENP